MLLDVARQSQLHSIVMNELRLLIASVYASKSENIDLLCTIRSYLISVLEMFGVDAPTAAKAVGAAGGRGAIEELTLFRKNIRALALCGLLFQLEHGKNFTRM